MYLPRNYADRKTKSFSLNEVNFGRSLQNAAVATIGGRGPNALFDEIYANILQRPVTKDVCIFCTTRLQFASTRPASRTQRRFFKSTGGVQRPPATAAVAQKEERDDQGWNTDWKAEPAPRQQDGAWASNAGPRDLTPEEQALRNALQTKSAFSPPIRKHEVNENDQQHYGAQERGSGGSQRGRRSESSWPPQHREGKGFARTSPASEGVFRKPYANDPISAFRITHPEPPTFQQATIRRSQSYIENGQPSSGRLRSHETFQTPNWVCPSCGYRNSHRSACQRCRSDRPINVIRKPDWTSAAPISRADRDAQLDHHIAQPLTTHEGHWDCPNCGFDNNRGNRYCGECGNDSSKSNSRDGKNDGLYAESWKHLRRRSDTLAEQDDQQHQSAVAGLSKDPRVDARIQAAERERMMRLERTRNGGFVGLRNGQDASGEEIVSRTPQHNNESPSKISRAAQPQPAAPKSDDGWVSWEPFPTRESDNKSVAKSRKAVPSPRATAALKGWEYPAEDSAAAGAFSPANNPTHAFAAESSFEQPSRVRSQISYDSDSDRDSLSRLSQGSGPYGTREPERRAKNSGIELTSVPNRGDRYKERKSKKFVSEVDFDDDEDALRAERRKQRKQKAEKNRAVSKAAAAPTPIHLPEFISVSNLARVLRVRVEDFAYKMNDLGFAETNNDHVLDAETAGLIAAEFNYEPIIELSGERDLLPLPPAQDKSVLPARPPVVTIMGHVDHGKTTLLDYLRKSSVAASEHGGITQHIGAFSVPMPGGRLVTFLDTPGHEAFLSMRQRGANVTDIVILVVAADDSVKPQTIEAIKHAQAARVPMIVAVNKIDKEDSNVEKVKQDLSRYGVEIEDYGGDTQIVCVSGKTGQGMEELEDAAVALADIMDMRSEIDGQAEGWVLEATTKKAGRVATVLVRRGTLRPGDVIVAGTSWARVRSLRNEAGTMISAAGPGTPVEIDGWREQPAAGDEVIQATDEQKAKSVIQYRLEASERTKMAADMEAVNEVRRLEQGKREQLEKAAQLAETNPDSPAPTSLSQTTTTPPAPTFQEVFFIVKADVSGSVEAVTNSVSALGNSEIRPYILRSGVGPITEFDIDHAAVAKGHIINFNTTIDGPIQRLAESKAVHIIDQSIIYRLVDDVRAKLGERLAPTVTQRVLGEAEIAQVFEINTKGRSTMPVAGCKVRNGAVSKTAKVRVVRGKEVVFDGTFSPRSTATIYPY